MLTPAERAQYEWQMWVEGFGEAGQEKLKAASVLVSRCGGVGGAAAWQLAAAGVGRIVLAHAGNLKASDLNRQTLMAHDWLGKPRVEHAAARLRALNPHIEVVAVPENIGEGNAARLIAGVDLVVDAAPLFEERFAMNRACVALGKPLVECAMYAMEVQVTTILPGRTPCLQCRVPEKPATWQRQFPVFGAVAGVAGNLGAVEAIKVLAGLGEPLAGKLLVMDLDTLRVRQLNLLRDPQCPVCAGLGQAGALTAEHE